MQDQIRCLVDLPVQDLVELRERVQALTTNLLRDAGQQDPSLPPENPS